MILDSIVATSWERVLRAQEHTPLEALARELSPSTRSFAAALTGGRQSPRPRLIAEYKRKSPSQGTLRPADDIADYLRLYGQYADAVSILTEYQSFGGQLEDLFTASEDVPLPVLRKDFIVDQYQILEARQFGADAVLLIARLLSDAQLKEFRELAESHGMDALVETHTEEEVTRALFSGAKIVGVNSRDLDTLDIDTERMKTLLRRIPDSVIAVAESGIANGIEMAALAGIADAALIGTSILRAPSPEAFLAELTGRSK